MPSHCRSRHLILSLHPTPLAVIGYAFASHLFLADGAEDDEPIDMCPDVFVCWLSSLTTGLQKGDLGEVMTPVPSTSVWYPFQIVFQFSYYVFV
jgi:hypothetical protein